MWKLFMMFFYFIPENFTSSDCEVAAAMIPPNREKLMLEIFSPRKCCRGDENQCWGNFLRKKLLNLLSRRLLCAGMDKLSPMTWFSLCDKKIKMFQTDVFIFQWQAKWEWTYKMSMLCLRLIFFGFFAHLLRFPGEMICYSEILISLEWSESNV